jgi:hypothetical protein
MWLDLAADLRLEISARLLSSNFSIASSSLQLTSIAMVPKLNFTPHAKAPATPKRRELKVGSPGPSDLQENLKPHHASPST